MALKFTAIDKPYMYGKTATVGNRMSEVVQTDSCCGLWHCFDWQDGKIVRNPGRRDTDYHSAMRQAKAFLRKRVTDTR
jgi:hypothetical protein